MDSPHEWHPVLRHARLPKTLDAYPESFRRDNIEGHVRLWVVISQDGAIQRSEVYGSSGIPELDAIAQQVLKNATYRPATSDGKPTSCVGIIPLDFKLHPLRPSNATAIPAK
jgi:periplasmic protein TonB